MCLFSNSITLHKTKTCKNWRIKAFNKKCDPRVRGGTQRVLRGAVTNRLLLTAAKDCSAPRGRNKNKYYREHISRSLLELNSAKHLFIQKKHQDFHTVRNIQPCSHTMGHLKTLFFFLIHNQAVRVQIFLGELISDSKSVL